MELTHSEGFDGRWRKRHGADSEGWKPYDAFSPGQVDAGIGVPRLLMHKYAGGLKASTSLPLEENFMTKAPMPVKRGK